MDAFKADKKAAADRVNELLDGKDDSEDETTTGLFLFNFAILKYLIPSCYKMLSIEKQMGEHQ